MASYYCLPTAVGRAKIANAVLTNQSVHLTQMAVGDGGGNPVSPVATQTALVREVYRRSINAMSLAQDQADTLVVEMVIPGTEGPFVVREVGVFDEDGDLIAIASFPATTKPAPSENATKDMVIVLYLKVADASVVTVAVNPSVVIATRTWVEQNFLLMPGAGATGQLVRKRSNAPNDWEYFNPQFDQTNFSVDAIEEAQVLAEDQLVIQWQHITTNGIAVYIDGERLTRSQHYQVLNETHIELLQPYAAGSRVLGVQNNPNGAITTDTIGALAKNANLGDVLNKPAARANMGLSYAAQTEAEGGSADAVVMTPKATKQQIDKRMADQAAAEAGADQSALMSPVGTRQQIDKRLAQAAEAIAGTDPAKLITPAVLKAVLDALRQELNGALHKTGELAFFAATVAPDGWVVLRGRSIGDAQSGASERAHADTQALFVHLWNNFPDRPLQWPNGVPAGRGTSALADYNSHKRLYLWNSQDEFWRSSGPSRAVGTWQTDELRAHAHTIYGQDNGAAPTGQTSNEVANVENPGANLYTRNTSTVGGTETRPRNLAWLPCIHL